MAQDTLTQTSQHAARGGERTSAFLYRLFRTDDLREPSSRHGLVALDLVLVGRGDAVRAARSAEGDALRTLTLSAPDGWMSTRHARLGRVLDRWVVEDLGSKNGVWVNGQKVPQAELGDGDVVELGHTFFLFRARQPYTEATALDLEATALGERPPGLRTLVPELAHAFEQLAVVARSNVSVVLWGASGTGKELLARAIHQLSGRTGPLVATNCGALPSELVESELFGHRRGAFSGAVDDRPGLVRASHGGTLLLDEVGELSPRAQPALLRVLQEREVVGVGATQPVPVDLRVVSATHRDLEAAVARGKFREDLLARLSGYTVRLPTLAERREDLGLLFAELLGRLFPARVGGLRLAPEAARALLAHGWPLNVRELEKALETAVVLARDGLVELDNLPEAVRHQRAGPARSAPSSDDDRRAQLVECLRKHRGNVSAVARELGKARMQIQRWMARFDLEPGQFRDG